MSRDNPSVCQLGPCSVSAISSLLQCRKIVHCLLCTPHFFSFSVPRRLGKSCLPILSPQWLVSIRKCSSRDWAWTSDWAGKQTPPSHHLLYALLSHPHSSECELPSGHAGLTTVEGDKLLDCHTCNLGPLLLFESFAVVVIHGEMDKGQALCPRVEQLVIEDWYRWLLRGKGKPLVSEA